MQEMKIEKSLATEDFRSWSTKAAQIVLLLKKKSVTGLFDAVKNKAVVTFF